ncbi:hypothetical protein ON010_g5292 [Phytophthora cinnamomi]|nr:hypothetical protein ON010_g5292 [Phytophthora cinnamomi]
MPLPGARADPLRAAGDAPGRVERRATRPELDPRAVAPLHRVLRVTDTARAELQPAASVRRPRRVPSAALAVARRRLVDLPACIPAPAAAAALGDGRSAERPAAPRPHDAAAAVRCARTRVQLRRVARLRAGPAPAARQLQGRGRRAPRRAHLHLWPHRPRRAAQLQPYRRFARRPAPSVLHAEPQLLALPPQSTVKRQ